MCSTFIVHCICNTMRKWRILLSFSSIRVSCLSFNVREKLASSQQAPKRSTALLLVARASKGSILNSQLAPGTVCMMLVAMDVCGSSSKTNGCHAYICISIYILHTLSRASRQPMRINRVCPTH